MNDTELRSKLGDFVIDQYRIIQHDSFDESQLKYIGKTKLGTPLWINKAVANATKVMGIGMITTHFLCGYGGGPKIILPGVAGKESIYFNHFNVGTRPDCKPGVKDNNPVWLDMYEAAKMLGLTFKVDVVLNLENEILFMSAGELFAEQKLAIEFYKKVYGFILEQPVNIAIASANPFHDYFDQTIKAMIYMDSIVKRGGTRIILAHCKEKLGPKHIAELYSQSFISSTSVSRMWPSPNNYLQRLKNKEFNNLADATGIYKFLQNNKSRLVLVSEGISKSEAHTLGFNYESDAQIAVEKAIEKYGSNCKVAIFPLGGVSDVHLK